jgi:hypothetical protein
MIETFMTGTICIETCLLTIICIVKYLVEELISSVKLSKLMRTSLKEEHIITQDIDVHWVIRMIENDFEDFPVVESPGNSEIPKH